MDCGSSLSLSLVQILQGKNTWSGLSCPSQPKDQTQVSCIEGSQHLELQGTLKLGVGSLSLFRDLPNPGVNLGLLHRILTSRNLPRKPKKTNNPMQNVQKTLADTSEKKQKCLPSLVAREMQKIKSPGHRHTPIQMTETENICKRVYEDVEHRKAHSLLVGLSVKQPLRKPFSSSLSLMHIYHGSVTQSQPDFATPWTAVRQASLSLTVSRSLLRFMSRLNW